MRVENCSACGHTHDIEILPAKMPLLARIAGRLVVFKHEGICQNSGVQIFMFCEDMDAFADDN
jgi:hypothetical protein